MKMNKPTDDPSLDALLQEWQVKPSLPPRFSEQVWRRIGSAETAPAPSVSLAMEFANWIAIMLPPSITFGTFVGLLGIASIRATFKVPKGATKVAITLAGLGTFDDVDLAQ